MGEQSGYQVNVDAATRRERYSVRYFLGPWAPGLVALAALQPGERVLDVACGTGVVTRLAAPAVGLTGQVTGLDLNAAMLAVARSLPPPSDASIRWVEGNAVAMDFPDASPLEGAGPRRPARWLKAIGVSGSKRYEPLPNAPVIAETGLPGFDAINWYPMMAPGVTPKDIVSRMNAEVVKALADPGVRERLMSQGLIPSPNTPDQLAAFIRDDTQRRKPVIKAAGVKLD